MSRLGRIFTLDTRSLALCRVATGLLVLGDLLTRAWTFRLHYTDLGVLPRQALFELNLLRFPSIYAASGWEPFLIALMVLHGVIAVLLSLGYRTRLNGPLLWYLTISLQQRLHMANNGGDTVLAAVLFWGMFLPWGETLSWDAAAHPDSRLAVGRVTTPATAILCLQMLAMYWISVLGKMEPTWLTGQVLYYAFQCDLYSRPLGQWLLPYTLMMSGLVYATLAWEVVGPALLLSPWPRVRAVTCLLFTLMHLSFGLFLRIGIFALTPILFSLALAPGWVWERPGAEKWLRRLQAMFETLAARHRPLPSPPLVLKRTTTVLLSLLFGLMLLTSLGEDKRIGRLLPLQTDRLMLMTGLYQRWGVFVDMPNILDGWFVVEGRLADGREVNLFQGTSKVAWDKPPTPFTHYTSYRWATPMVVITSDTRLHRWFVRALCLDWQRQHPGDRLVWARFNLMREQTQPDFQAAKLTRQVLWQGDPSTTP